MHFHYLFKVRELVYLVKAGKKRGGGDGWNVISGQPTLHAIKYDFSQKNKDNEEFFNEVMAIAVGDGYLVIHGSKYKEQVIITPEGTKFLTKVGFTNALGHSVKGISPFVAILISILALIVSILH